MENASKALIMAAEILLGVMIISIGVYLFSTLRNYSAETVKGMEDTQIEQFNNQFLKFYGTSGGETITCTIHDIVGLANYVQKTNETNGFIEVESVSDSSYYIQIDLKTNGKTIEHLETKTQDELVNIIKENDVMIDESGETVTKKFYVEESPKVGEYTRRVNYIKFEEYVE